MLQSFLVLMLTAIQVEEVVAIITQQEPVELEVQVLGTLIRAME